MKRWDNRYAAQKYISDYKSGKQCECGESHLATLDFHHRDPKRKKYTISQMVHKGYPLDKIKHEIRKCDLVCINCHAKINWKEKRGN